MLRSIQCPMILERPTAGYAYAKDDLLRSFVGTRDWRPLCSGWVR